MKIGINDLEQLVFDTIRSQVLCFTDTDVDYKSGVKASAEELNSYEHKIKALQNSKRELYEQYILGAVDEDTYKSKKADIENQLADMKNLCNIAAAKARSAQDDYEESIKSAEITAAINGADGLTQALADKLIERVYVFPNNRIEIKYAVRMFS